MLIIAQGGSLWQRKNRKTLRVEIPELELKTFPLHIVGDTPLIVNAWSTKAKQEILQKHMKTAKVGKEIRRPWVEFADSLYWLTEKPNLDELTNEQVRDLLQEVIPNSKFGFPVIAFKACALNAGFQQAALDRNGYEWYPACRVCTLPESNQSSDGTRS